MDNTHHLHPVHASGNNSIPLETNLVECPICSISLPSDHINQHLDSNHFNPSTPSNSHNKKINLPETPLNSSRSNDSEPTPKLLQSTIPSNSPNNTSTKKRPSHSSFPSETASQHHHSQSSSIFTSKKPRRESLNPFLQHSSSPLSSSCPSTSNVPDRSTSTSRQPLAERVRPKLIEDLKGLSDLKTTLKTLVTCGHSLILWGPSGSGKTTLARCLKNSLSGPDRNPHLPKYDYFELSGSEFSTTEWKKIIDKSSKNHDAFGHNSNKSLKFKTSLASSTVPFVFVDEAQRLNKAQQDLFLPHLESGRVIMIFATTENPSFRLNIPLLSRCHLIQLNRHTIEDLKSIIERAIQIEGLNGQELIDSDLIDLVCVLADGDARVALSSLDLIIQSKIQDPLINHQTIKEQILGKRSLLYDRNGDNHYELISALHKSIRGGDASAGLYWLARMLEGGEDPLYVARRLIRMASEDIGLANPAALNQAVSAYQATQLIGMPECDCILAQVVVMLAESPKSVRVYKAYNQVKSFVGCHPAYPVPIHLRNAPTKMMKELGYGVEYKYEPDYAHPVYQEFLPPEIMGSSSRSLSSMTKGLNSTSPPFLTPSYDTKRLGKQRLVDEEDYEQEPERNGVSHKNDHLTLTNHRNNHYNNNEDNQNTKIVKERIITRNDGKIVDFQLLKEWEDKVNNGQPWLGRHHLLDWIQNKKE